MESVLFLVFSFVIKDLFATVFITCDWRKLRMIELELAPGKEYIPRTD